MTAERTRAPPWQPDLRHDGDGGLVVPLRDATLVVVAAPTCAVLEAAARCALMDEMAHTQHTMQAQINLNTDAVNQVILDHQHLATQVEATGKAVARLTLEQMARDMEESVDSYSQSSDFQLSPNHRVPPQKKAGIPHPHRSNLDHKIQWLMRGVYSGIHVGHGSGITSRRHALNGLLDLKQSGTMEEYVDAFETLQYQAQVPETMERAIMLAKIQQELHEKNSAKSHKSNVGGKGLTFLLGNQILNPRGDLTDEVLTQLAMEDSLAAEFGTLYLNAVAGTETGCCFKLRALVNNKVMLILVDSGSSHSFEFADVFTAPTALPPHRSYDHTITLLPGSVPVNSKPYRYSPLRKDGIERQVKVLLDQGWIVHSTSPFASPVLLVQKKDGSWRLCVDYRRLNALTVKNRFPIPVVEKILDELAGTTHFTKLDLIAGYHQVRMAPQDEHKTAFKTHHGHYQFRAMPFGLTNAPATFQCIMNDILEPFLRKYVLVFMDDILIYSSSLQQHVQHLRAVLMKLREHQFYLKPSKCSFAQPQIEYLGHIISQEGVATDPSKTAAMQQWPVPTSATELRGFLGLTGYYRRFIKGYGLIVRPLHNLLKKNALKWSDQAQEAFLALNKQAMQEAPVLALPDFQEVFVVETDACALGIGAVLMQHNRPLAFLSKALAAKQQHLSIYEKEFLALIMVVEKWQSYLQSTEFIIRTDHRGLAYLLEMNLHSEMQRKAMAQLMGLQFKVVYRKGKENVTADALSRVAHLMAIQAVSVVQPVWVQEVLNSDVTDSQAQQLLTQLAIHSPDENGFALVDGLIKHKGHIWVGNNSALRTKIISAMHS
ncbi:hypothetical protein U9M48_003975 [Paspalum notatum var. saurae]|uniref:Reverse transcriptase domain-containing protein n=1 Tax=Paspalum notatum var. saurae TaxID=547442 RepID=A0AAQ3SKD8_PASNO